MLSKLAIYLGMVEDKVAQYEKVELLRLSTRGIVLDCI